MCEILINWHGCRLIYRGNHCAQNISVSVEHTSCMWICLFVYCCSAYINSECVCGMNTLEWLVGIEAIAMLFVEIRIPALVGAGGMCIG